MIRFEPAQLIGTLGIFSSAAALSFPSYYIIPYNEACTPTSDNIEWYIDRTSLLVGSNWLKNLDGLVR